MKTILHSGVSRLQTLIYALVLSVILPACTDDADRELTDTGKGGTVTIELSLSVPPIVETKAVICEADSGSEARKAGFYYEMQVQTTDTTGNAGKPVATKAASSLKNIYAFLFRTDNGAFNGRASIEGPVDLTQKLMLAFSGVTDVSSRLVVIANDAIGADYTSSTNFANFSGTYTEFQNLMLTSGITKDEDIPYVGSTTVTLSDGVYILTTPVSLYRMLAKIVLKNKTFNIEGGPARNSINLYNAGNKYFGSPNSYDGVGTTITTSGRYLTTATPGVNEDTNTWYVGENVQTTDSTKATYIELETEVGDVSNTTPKVGEEYTIESGAFKYKVYLKDYALRRNNVYTVRVNVSGPLAYHQTLASTTGSNVSKESTVVHGGLNIGMFGGASNYTTGSGAAPTTGSYTKYLLLQPNTSGSTSDDNVRQKWSTNTSVVLQPETRKYWDNTYTTSTMKNDANASIEAYKYCNELSFAVDQSDKGQWYLPTHAQLCAIYGIYRGIKGNSSYTYYSALNNSNYYFYWSATEWDANRPMYVKFSQGSVNNNYKSNSFYVRCVRNLPSDDLSAQTVTTVTIDGEDYPVIDLSALQPLGAVLSSEEASARRTLMNQQTPSYDTELEVGYKVSGEMGTWNTKMSIKFQVMRADPTVEETDWVTAYNQCKSYNGEGGSAGQWRLPTQRELMMIWILHPQLIGIGGFTAVDANTCWSANEDYNRTESSSWHMNFSNGVVKATYKTEKYRVRCVRDL